MDDVLTILGTRLFLMQAATMKQAKSLTVFNLV